MFVKQSQSGVTGQSAINYLHLGEINNGKICC